MLRVWSCGEDVEVGGLEVKVEPLRPGLGARAARVELSGRELVTQSVAAKP